MRVLCIAIGCLLLAAIVGCESPTPPSAGERAEFSPPPPEPAKPPDPPSAEELEAKRVAAAGGAKEVSGQAAIAKARELGMARQKEEEEAAKKAAAEGQPAPAEEAPKTDTPPADAPPEGDPQAPGDELKKAEVGVGTKGKDYGGPGFVTTPIETLFRVEDRIAFEVQIPNTMKIYKADHDNKGPKTHEEFMNVIIKENAVKLPELPAGSSYWYDAKSEALLVRTPKPKS